MDWNLQRLALVAVAGALGALSRYELQNGVVVLVGRPTLLGTFVVNLSGAFALGLLIGLGQHHLGLAFLWRTVLGVGFLGAYTTFSTLMLDSVIRFEGDQIGLGLLNLGGSVALGLVATYVGLTLGRAL